MTLENGLKRLIMIKIIKDLFSIGKNTQVPGLFKDELGGKLITEFAALRPKAHAYLDGYSNEHKKAKDRKKCAIKKVYVSKFRNKCF